MNKLIIFDLDGVLYDSKIIHFESLNKALEKIDSKYVIAYEQHLSRYDGLPTVHKLALLNKNLDLPENLNNQISADKQKFTLEMLDGLDENKELTKLIKQLKSDGYYLACASNSVKQTVVKVLEQLSLINYFDLVLSNEDVSSPKPHPEIYWKSMLHFKLFPDECIIFEDSPVGRKSADLSGANTIFVNSQKEVIEKLRELINNKGYFDKGVKMQKYKNEKLRILIPMAGRGSRFAEKGYSFPKPLVEVHKKPMIQVVIENLNIECEYIFLVQKEHVENFNIDKMLKIIVPNCKIVELDEVTEGAASTTLLAKHLINDDRPLLIANSDQFVSWDPNEVLYSFINKNVDGGILTFKSTHPKWSYAKTDENGYVVEVAEKNPISDNATVGIYYWKKGSDYVNFAEQMIRSEKRVNNEFYVCPVYNEAILANKKIITEEIESMWGIGTPEDLDVFLKEEILES
jgi:HAD superfamily hydrolase (TIGR01509 family)